MNSPIPGDEKSEGSEVAPRPCFGVDGRAEVVVRSEVRVEEVLRGGGGDFKLFDDEIWRAFFPSRCLCNMKNGMASARLVPMNCGRYLAFGR